MSTEIFLYAFVSALGNTANSLVGASALRTKKMTAMGVALVSLAPSFIIALYLGLPILGELTFFVLILMLLKNSLYAVGFYLRYLGLDQLGAFQGSFLAAVQPVLVGALSSRSIGDASIRCQS